MWNLLFFSIFFFFKQLTTLDIISFLSVLSLWALEPVARIDAEHHLCLFMTRCPKTSIYSSVSEKVNDEATHFKKETFILLERQTTTQKVSVLPPRTNKMARTLYLKILNSNILRELVIAYFFFHISVFPGNSLSFLSFVMSGESLGGGVHWQQSTSATMH